MSFLCSDCSLTAGIHLCKKCTDMHSLFCSKNEETVQDGNLQNPRPGELAEVADMNTLSDGVSIVDASQMLGIRTNIPMMSQLRDNTSLRATLGIRATRN
ncbi:uncharacterized protein DFL_000089 [Arthrobotrys flagrans]|uniref:Uncharacterized protein n=1 Tax=Arthrobotrys flagrans TaxID=97331 RepID=A0A437AE25_ARTFL|nr:hypothetical protein DFL_000089 [Arthrobotrys flagrans]